MVVLKFGDVLAQPDDPIRQVYFPLTASISSIVPSGAGSTLEVGLIGNEGMLGASLLLNTTLNPLLSLVQGSGSALRMSAGSFVGNLDRFPCLKDRILLYNYVLFRQVSQMAVCAHFHELEARLARWLLMTQDRSSEATLHLTHEFLAKLLGVRRVGITHAAGTLQAAKIIDYRRGEIVVLDRQQLEARSCRCYSADIDLYQRIMS